MSEVVIKEWFDGDRWELLSVHQGFCNKSRVQNDVCEVCMENGDNTTCSVQMVEVENKYGSNR